MLQKPGAPSSGLRALLTASAICVFLGRAWQHLFRDTPYRELFWDEKLMSGPVRFVLGRSWGDYVTDPSVEEGIQRIISGTGIFYVVCAMAALLLTTLPRLGRLLLSLGGTSLAFLALLYAKEHGLLWVTFFEYSLQWGSPFLLLVLYRTKDLTPGLVIAMKAAVALTFTCHGLFALGLYPTPGYFVDMVMNILGLEQPGAVAFLKIAGALDLMVSILIFFPPASKAALIYTVCWGFLTALARLVAFFEVEQWQEILDQWLYEAVMRAPHFLVPYLLFRFRPPNPEP